MNMLNWAENEVRIACKREAPDRKDGEWDYGCACYESALKAYKSLCEDGHSSYSFNLTRQILIRLMNHNPLTPIEDTPDSWYEPRIETGSYQCVRKTSLFKNVYSDGTIEYSDVDRVCCVDIDSPGVPYFSGFVSNLINKLYPITMPYCPDDTPIKVMCETFLVDPKNGDFDTRGIRSATMPDGSIVELNRYFAEKDGEWVEIDETEYLNRKNNKYKEI